MPVGLVIAIISMCSPGGSCTNISAGVERHFCGQHSRGYIIAEQREVVIRVTCKAGNGR